MKYLVTGSGGPGYASGEEAAEVLPNLVFPAFKRIMELEKKKKILAGGLPVGERAFVCIVEAKSHDELDRLLQSIPMWGVLDWEVTPLQSVTARYAQERKAIRELKKSIKRR